MRTLGYSFDPKEKLGSRKLQPATQPDWPPLVELGQEVAPCIELGPFGSLKLREISIPR